MQTCTVQPSKHRTSRIDPFLLRHRPYFQDNRYLSKCVDLAGNFCCNLGLFIFANCWSGTQKFLFSFIQMAVKEVNGMRK